MCILSWRKKKYKLMAMRKIPRACLKVPPEIFISSATPSSFPTSMPSEGGQVIAQLACRISLASIMAIRARMQKQPVTALCTGSM